MSVSTTAEYSLDLNEHHQNEIFNYMRFARYLRKQRLRAVDTCFEDVKASRLLDETFTLEEITDTVNELSLVVKAEVESELINMAYSNALLLQQILSQAEKWHLKIQVNTTDLENRELLDKVKNFEEKKIQDLKDSTGQASPIKHRLEPMNDLGGAFLLQQEIDRLQEDNMKLRQRLKHVESQASTLLQDRSTLSDDLKKVKGELDATRSYADSEMKEEVNRLNEQLLNAKCTIGDLQTSVVQKEDTEKNLTQMGHQLLRVQEQLELAEKEMEKKVSQTTAYINLKKMLHQKNELIKMLRKKLANYEPDASSETAED